jgi:hypothetical protein
MVQLIKTYQVFQIDRLFEVTLEAVLRSTQVRLGRSRVRFLVARSADLQIKLDQAAENELSNLEIVEDDARYWRANPYGGRYLTKIEPYLDTRIFFNHDMDKYVYDNVRFSIVGSNSPETLVEIDPQKGHMSLAANKSLDREEIAALLLFGGSNSMRLWFNVSIFDKRKLFRPTWTLVYLKVLDLNDNAPKYAKNEFHLDLDLNTIQNTHESALIGNRQYFLVFNQSARDYDLGENGTLTYYLHKVNLIYDLFDF